LSHEHNTDSQLVTKKDQVVTISETNENLSMENYEAVRFIGERRYDLKKVTKYNDDGDKVIDYFHDSFGQLKETYHFTYNDKKEIVQIVRSQEGKDTITDYYPYETPIEQGKGASQIIKALITHESVYDYNRHNENGKLCELGTIVKEERSLFGWFKWQHEYKRTIEKYDYDAQGRLITKVRTSVNHERAKSWVEGWYTERFNYDSLGRISESIETYELSKEYHKRFYVTLKGETDVKNYIKHHKYQYNEHNQVVFEVRINKPLNSTEQFKTKVSYVYDMRGNCIEKRLEPLSTKILTEFNDKDKPIRQAQYFRKGGLSEEEQKELDEDGLSLSGEMLIDYDEKEGLRIIYQHGQISGYL